MTDEELRENIESIRAEFHKEILGIEARFTVRVDSLLGVLRDFGLTSAVEEEPAPTQAPEEIVETPKKRNRIKAQVLDEKPNIPSTPATVAPKFEKRAFSLIYFKNYFEGHLWNKYPIRRQNDAHQHATFSAGNLTEAEFLDLCQKFEPFSKAWHGMVNEGKAHLVPGLSRWIDGKRWTEDPSQYHSMPQGRSGTAIQGRKGSLGTMYSEAIDGAIESPGDTSTQESLGEELSKALAIDFGDSDDSEWEE